VRVATDTHAGQLLGLRVLVAVKAPVDDERVGELVAQKAEARYLDRVPPLLPWVGLDLHELNL
jgi:hypothetical protein